MFALRDETSRAEIDPPDGNRDAEERDVRAEKKRERERGKTTEEKGISRSDRD